jgi:6-phosphogluconolactonase/glucosamine-6-phosphate isomerase/deaminase
MSLVKTIKADRLTVKIYDSRKAMGDAAAADVAAKIKEIANEKGEVNMIFASAPSQNEFLAGLLADKDIPWEKVNTFHMDEYIGLDKDAPQGFGNFIRDRLWGKVQFCALGEGILPIQEILAELLAAKGKDAYITLEIPTPVQSSLSQACLLQKEIDNVLKSMEYIRRIKPSLMDRKKGENSCPENSV